MVREGDEDKKKKGWFSRKKKPSRPTSHVSRPPSASSFPSFSHRKQSSSSSAPDEDLPPREEKALPSRPGTPDTKPSSPQTPTNVAEEGPALPVRAGFDFKAIKDVIGKAELNPEELKIPAPSRFPAPSIPPPTMRTESAPPLNPEPESLTPRPRSSLDLSSPGIHDEPVAGPSSLYTQDLSSSLTRHLSLEDHEEEEEEEYSHASTQASFFNDSTPSGLTFGSRNGVRWDMPDDLNSSSYTQDPSFKSVGSTSYSSPALNPFASPLDSTSLSFGGEDGTITFSPSPSIGVEPDPWAIGTRSLGGSGTKKSASTLDLNPWKS